MKKPLVIAGIVAALVGVIAYGRHNTGGPAIEVQMEKLSQHVIRSSVLASGRIAFDRKADLTSEIVGIVTAIHVHEGERVRKSQLVLELRPEEFAAAVAQSKASIEVQQAAIERARLNVVRVGQQLDRDRKLRDAQQISADAYEQSSVQYEIAKVDLKSAEAALLQAQAQLREADNRLSKTRVYAPLDGVVASIDIKEGETAIPSIGGIPGSTLMSIVDPTSIYAQVNVDEGDIGNVGKGDEARVVAVAFPNDTIVGKLDSVAATAKVAEGRQGLSFAVKIRLDRPEQVRLSAGMSCRAEILAGKGLHALAAPIDAVIVEENRVANETNHFVFVSRDEVARRVPVNIGALDDSYQVVSSGVKEGELLIVGPNATLQKLKDGDRVRARGAILARQ